MNSKYLVFASAAAMAFSANAALFVTSSTSTGANSGIAPDSFLPPAIIVFTPDVSGTLTSLGLFDNGGDGFAEHGPGFTVALWENTTGNEGSVLRSASFTGTGGTLAGGGNEWRLQTVTSVSLNAGTSYALVVRDNGNPGSGLFSGFGAGNHGAGDSTLAAGVSATYSGITVSSVFTRTGFAVDATDIFRTSGGDINALSSTQYRFATGDFTAVPEPSTYALVAGAGLAGFGLWRRRSTKA